MTVKERLRELVDQLSEREAARALGYLEEQVHQRGPQPDMTLSEKVDQLRGSLQHLSPPGHSLADELIAERRQEARREGW